MADNDTKPKKEIDVVALNKLLSLITSNQEVYADRIKELTELNCLQSEALAGLVKGVGSLKARIESLETNKFSLHTLPKPEVLN